MTHTAPSHQDAQIVRYEKPEFERSKAVVLLGRTEIAFMLVQVVREGGENNLHFHELVDGFWFVLNGRARFYTTDDELVADLGPLEGVVIPRGFPYWFESAGAEELELLQFGASTKTASSLEEFGRDRRSVVGKMNLGKVANFGEDVRKLGDD